MLQKNVSKDSNFSNPSLAHGKACGKSVHQKGYSVPQASVSRRHRSVGRVSRKLCTVCPRCLQADVDSVTGAHE